MALITVQNLSIRFRGPALLDGVTCQIGPKQRIGLLGRNGAGKTTFMKILLGEVEPDDGEVVRSPGCHVTQLAQDVPRELQGRVRQVVEAGVEVNAEKPAWEAEQLTKRILSRLNLSGDADFQSLSSGQKRRVLLARALVGEPDLLLLDEPTNHLDIESITWLEEFLDRWSGSLLFVTHDRVFLRRIANRILEIDAGKLFDWSCDYDTFLERKEAALAAEEKEQALFDKRLAQEEAWIRQGIKARRTRNEGRVKALKRMRETRRERPVRPGEVRLQIQQAERSGNLVINAKDLSFAYPDRTIVSDFSTHILRGDKVGLVGPNGSGKTTLLKLLLGELTPDKGSVKHGTNLQVVYFDQLREQLNDSETVQESVGQGATSVNIGGRSRHVIGYLQEFLFSPERARTEVRFLSGGERNRLLLARLFTKPANLLVLDEPTNDLDTETLEILEDRLVQFDGTLLLVSHDRAFLNNVVTSCIAFEPDGVREYVGGYDDWLRQRPTPPESATKAKGPDSEDKPNRSSPRSKKLSYKEQQELSELPTRIEQLEAEVAELHAAMAEPSHYQQPPDIIAAEQARLRELESTISESYERWESLEERNQG